MTTTNPSTVRPIIIIRCGTHLCVGVTKRTSLASLLVDTLLATTTLQQRTPMPGRHHAELTRCVPSVLSSPSDAPTHCPTDLPRVLAAEVSAPSHTPLCCGVGCGVVFVVSPVLSPIHISPIHFLSLTHMTTKTPLNLLERSFPS